MHKTGIETFNRHVATRRFVSIPCTTLKRISTSTRVVVRRKSGESRSERERDRKKERKREYSTLALQKRVFPIVSGKLPFSIVTEQRRPWVCFFLHKRVRARYRIYIRAYTHTYSGERDSVDLENLERADAFSLPCSLGKRVKDKFGSYDRFRNDLFAARFEYLRGTISFRIYFSRYVIVGISQRHIKYLFRLIPRPRLTRNGNGTRKMNFPRVDYFYFVTYLDKAAIIAMK